MGSDNSERAYSSSSLHPPKKRRSYHSLPETEQLNSSNGPVDISGPTSDKEDVVKIDLAALTYYPACESTFDAPNEECLEEIKDGGGELDMKRPVRRSEMALQAAIRQIAKQRRKKLRNLF